MIIDVHGHYTTAPAQHEEWRKQQIDAKGDLAQMAKPDGPTISDDEIRATIETTQLRLQRERGTDITLFSPRGGGMGHHIGDERMSQQWTRQCNNLIRRVCDLFPDNFAPVCQLPQSSGCPPENSIPELLRCVEGMGFVGCNLNPDPTGGFWTEPPLTDPWWFKLYEKLEELGIPAMIHVSQSNNRNFHFTGDYYINSDTTAFMQLLLSDLFVTFPGLKFIIPHAGGAVPYHWGRYQGLALDRNLRSPEEMMGDNLFFDTCVYNQPGMDLLVETVPTRNILFASEMHGALRCVNPRTGHHFDDTRRYIDANRHLGEQERADIFSTNALRLFSRLQTADRHAGTA